MLALSEPHKPELPETRAKLKLQFSPVILARTVAADLNDLDIKKIYISGKITGLPVREAIAKFRSAAEKIRRFGFEPVSPFDNGLPLEADWAEHIGKDISLLLRCDAIYLLDDYEKSEGARIELCIALHRRMPVFMNVRPKLGFFSVQTFEDYDKEKV